MIPKPQQKSETEQDKTLKIPRSWICQYKTYLQKIVQMDLIRWQLKGKTLSWTVCHLMNQQIFCVIMFWRHVSKSTLPNVLWFSHKCFRPDHCQWGSCFGKGITFPAYEWLSCWVITERRTRWKEQCQNLLNIKFISALNFTSWNKTLFTYNWYLRSKSDLLFFEGFYTSSP